MTWIRERFHTSNTASLVCSHNALLLFFCIFANNGIKAPVSSLTMRVLQAPRVQVNKISSETQSRTTLLSLNCVRAILRLILLKARLLDPFFFIVVVVVDGAGGGGGGGGVIIGAQISPL